MRYFFVEPETIRGKQVRIAEPDAGHIRKVLRLKPGYLIGLLDGSGSEYHARIEAMDREGVLAVIENQVECRSESPIDLTLAQGFLKESKMDDLVRQLSELGVNRWIPFMAERSIPSPNDQQLIRRTERWQTISRQAIKQCRRGRVMQVSAPLSFTDMLSASRDSDLRIAFWENETTPLRDLRNAIGEKPVASVFVLVGPEGGLADWEVRDAKAAGFHVAGLGPRILRAETATVAACALVQHLFGDLG